VGGIDRDYGWTLLILSDCAEGDENNRENTEKRLGEHGIGEHFTRTQAIYSLKEWVFDRP
jgi:hypothetical protein